MAPFPRPAHRTGHADRPHPTLGQNFTPSLSPSHAPAWSGVRARGARTGARGDSSRPCVAEPCACGVATDATARRCSGRARGTHRCPCLDRDQVPCRDVAHFRHHLSHGRCQSGMSGAATRTRIVEDAFRGLFAMDRGCGQGARAREGGGLDSAAIRPQICEVRAAFPMNGLAERAGFEPALGDYPKHAFQACDLNRSSTSPVVLQTGCTDFTANAPSRSQAGGQRRSDAAGPLRIA